MTSTKIGSDRAREMLSGMSVTQQFPFQFGSWQEGQASVTLMPGQKDLQVADRVHGGILTTLADTAGVYLFLPTISDAQSMTSVEFKLNFLRPATLAGGDLHAIARRIQRGRNIMVCQTEVLQKQKSVACGMFTYLITMDD